MDGLRPEGARQRTAKLVAVAAEAKFATVQKMHGFASVELDGELLDAPGFLDGGNDAAALGDVVDDAVAHLHIARETRASIENALNFALKRFQ